MDRSRCAFAIGVGLALMLGPRAPAAEPAASQTFEAWKQKDNREWKAFISGQTNRPARPTAPAARLREAVAVSTLDLWQRVWQDFQDNYSYFSHKEIDWTSALAASSNRFADVSPAQFATNLNEVLQVLHDWHVVVTGPDGTAAGYRGPVVRNVARYLYSWPTYTGGAAYTDVADAHVVYHAWIQTNIAHVIIRTLQTEACAAIDDDEIETLFRTYAAAAGLVIDIRDNDGGSEDVASRFASHLTTEPIIYGYWKDRIPGTVPYQYSGFKYKKMGPSAGTCFRGPVAALIGQRCMSSAEWFTLMLRGCPRVTLIGDRTRGASGSPVEREIPELGVRYQFSTWVAYTSDKFPFEDAGIAPAIAIAPETSFDAERLRDFVLERACEWIRGQPAAVPAP